MTSVSTNISELNATSVRLTTMVLSAINALTTSKGTTVKSVLEISPVLIVKIACPGIRENYVYSVIFLVIHALKTILHPVSRVIRASRTIHIDQLSDLLVLMKT